MTKAKALDSFFNSFGIPAYPSRRVPDKVAFPYMTYEETLASNGNMTNPRVCLWYYGESEKPINAKADEIMKAIGMCHPVPCEDGTIYVYFQGTWQSLSDQADDKVGGRFTNLTIVFNTK